MRSKWRFKLYLWLAIALFAPSSFAQEYTRWGLPKGAKMRIGKGEITSNISYSPDGTRIAFASTAGIWIYDASTGAELNLLTGHTARVGSVAYSPDGAILASGGGRDDPTIRLWDAYTGERQRTLKGHALYINCFGVFPTTALPSLAEMASAQSMTTQSVCGMSAQVSTCERLTDTKFR